MTDPTAAIEVWARMLCAADVHVHDGDHPTWQQLSVAQHGRGQDDYRKAARWLLPRLTVAAAPAGPAPATDDVRAQLLHALDFSYCQGLGYGTPEELLAAYDASRAELPAPDQQTAVTVDELAHALDNSTPYPIELTSTVARFMAERLLEMLTISKRAEHPVWQPEEQPEPGEQPQPQDPDELRPLTAEDSEGSEPDAVRRETVLYFLECRAEDGGWESPILTLEDLDEANRQLAAYRGEMPHFEYRVARQTTTVVVQPLPESAREARQDPTQDGTEAHPAEHRWAAELYDPVADEWVPGTRYPDRDRAVKHLAHASAIGPKWKDGTPVQRRLVRATTTYTVEDPAAVARSGQPDTEA
jgi:hypothetical protein